MTDKGLDNIAAMGVLCRDSAQNRVEFFIPLPQQFNSCALRLFIQSEDSFKSTRVDSPDNIRVLQFSTQRSVNHV